MAQQQVFNLFSSDLLPAAVDLILFASLNGDVAIRIDSDQIAGTVKAVGVKGAGIMLRAFEITTEGVRTTCHQASGLSLG